MTRPCRRPFAPWAQDRTAHTSQGQGLFHMSNWCPTGVQYLSNKIPQLFNRAPYVTCPLIAITIKDIYYKVHKIDIIYVFNYDNRLYNIESKPSSLSSAKALLFENDTPFVQRKCVCQTTITFCKMLCEFNYDCM